MKIIKIIVVVNNLEFQGCGFGNWNERSAVTSQYENQSIFDNLNVSIIAETTFGELQDSWVD